MGKKRNRQKTEVFSTGKPAEDRKTANGFYFLAALTITMAVLSAAAYAVLFYYRPNQTKPVQQDVSSTVIRGTEETCLNLLIFISQSDSQLTSCTTLRLDLVNGAVSVMTLPPQTVLYAEDGPTSLKDTYDRGKEPEALALFNRSFNTKIEKYLALTEEKSMELVKQLGGIDYTLPYEIHYEKDKKPITLLEGLSYFDSDKLKKLLDYPSFKEGKNHKYLLQSHLTCLFLNQYLPDMQTERIDELYSWLINNGITNLSVMDLESRKTYLISLIQAENDFASALIYSGSFSEDEALFTLSDDSRLLIQTQFP